MEENKGKSRFLWMHKAMLIAFMDGLIVLSSYFMALLMRFDFIFSQIPQEYIAGYLWSMPFWITSTIVVFYVFRLYHSVWRLATVVGANAVVEPYCFVGDSCTLKSGTIVKSTSVLEMGTETEQGTVLFTPLEKK